MASDPDRLLKRVWLVNGFLLLALGCIALLGLGLAFASQLLRRDGNSVRAVRAVEPRSGVMPRAVRYDPPVPIRGTAVRLVGVRHGEADQPIVVPDISISSTGTAASGGRYRPGGHSLVNIIFLEPGGRGGRLLLDRPAFIAHISYPVARTRNDPYMLDPPGDTLQTWISYQIAFEDTNRDGILDHQDRAGLYVSALDGTNLRRAAPEGVWIQSHTVGEEGRSILVFALEPPGGKENVPPEQMRQRAFLYDVPTGTIRPYGVLDSLATRAGIIVGR
jgi:hypothetical protein